jgi:hypothetical protein
VAAVFAHSRVLSTTGSPAVETTPEPPRGGGRLNASHMGWLVLIIVFGVIPATYLLHDRIPHVQISVQHPVSQAKAVTPTPAPAPAQTPAPKQVPAPVKPTPEAAGPDDAAIRAVFSATPVSKVFTPADYAAGRVHDFLGFHYILRNTGAKTIRAVAGRETIQDLFGDEISTGTIKFEERITPGHSVGVDYGWTNYNPYIEHQARVKNTPFENLKVTFTPEMILFDDGTKLGSFSE